MIFSALITGRRTVRDINRDYNIRKVTFQGVR